MEKSLVELEADLELLRGMAVQFRMLSDQHRLANNIEIADKLLEFVHELDDKILVTKQSIRRSTSIAHRFTVLLFRCCPLERAQPVSLPGRRSSGR
jgi:hypothetical protein